MEFLSRKRIRVDRELSDLDSFTLSFLGILSKHSEYVIVSGYVAILLGRSRSSEDVDVISQKKPKEAFIIFANNLFREGFYCLNAEKPEDMYSYLEGNIPIRFAKKGQVIPNIEMKWAKNPIEQHALNRRIVVELGNEEVHISPLELQIAFKERVLKSPKDMEDARHLRIIAEGHLDEGDLRGYEVMLDGFC